MSQQIVVRPYNPCWREAFEHEALRLREVFGFLLVDVYHIGSTAVPGLKAKPIIDIMSVVRDIEKVDEHNEELCALGYEPMGEFGLPGRRY